MAAESAWPVTGLTAADERSPEQSAQQPAQQTAQLPRVCYKRGEAPTTSRDQVAVEAPLGIAYAGQQGEPQPVTSLLRTPGDDVALTAGFLFAEGQLRRRADLDWMHYCVEEDTIQVRGKPAPRSIPRMELTHAGCGGCSLRELTRLYPHLAPVQGVNAQGKPAEDLLELARAIAERVQDQPREQPLFAATGGSHAAFVYNARGEPLAGGEDIGRHNALDKAIGRLWLDERLHQARIAWVSGRLGFELAQKSINAGIQALVSVGAPSSLALELAHQYKLVAFAFSRKGSFNFYPPV